MTQCEAIIEAFKDLGGIRNQYEIKAWVERKYGSIWKDYGTCMADMVPKSCGGNSSSTVPEKYRILERVSSGEYRLLMDKP